MIKVIKIMFLTSICLTKIYKCLSQSYSTRMRAKELTRLELALSQVFLDLDESKKAAKPTLGLSQVVFTAQMRGR
jgi:hypothetical protein